MKKTDFPWAENYKFRYVSDTILIGINPLKSYQKTNDVGYYMNNMEAFNFKDFLQKDFPDFSGKIKTIKGHQRIMVSVKNGKIHGKDAVKKYDYQYRPKKFITVNNGIIEGQFGQFSHGSLGTFGRTQYLSTIVPFEPEYDFTFATLLKKSSYPQFQQFYIMGESLVQIFDKKFFMVQFNKYKEITKMTNHEITEDDIIAMKFAGIEEINYNRFDWRLDV